MNTTYIRRTIHNAITTTRHIAYRTLSGHIATLLDHGHLLRTGDLLERLGAADLKDGYQSWYGRHVTKAYRATTGTEPLKVWAQHRTTGHWVHVNVYAPTDPALYAGLRTYKRTAHLATTTVTLAA